MGFITPKRVAVALATFAVVGVALAAIIVKTTLGDGDEAGAGTVREYSLEIVATDIDYGAGNVWHAWTFKNADDPTGAVPGPTLTVNAGEKLVVNVKNNLDMVHSFHTHLSGYDQEDDGAQTNIISGKGTGAMIPAGGEWTYTFDRHGSRTTTRCRHHG